MDGEVGGLQVREPEAGFQTARVHPFLPHNLLLQCPDHGHLTDILETDILDREWALLLHCYR